MRDTVRQVAHLFPTAIISGRGRDKVEAFVQLPELFYAGSHGMDIAGPRGEYSIGTPHNFQAAAEFRPLIDQLYSDLCTRCVWREGRGRGACCKQRVCLCSGSTAGCGAVLACMSEHTWWALHAAVVSHARGHCLP
jgi:hypothetical protein